MDRPYALPADPVRAFPAMTDHESCRDSRDLLLPSMPTIRREHHRRLFFPLPEFFACRATASGCVPCVGTSWLARSPASCGAVSVSAPALPLRRAVYRDRSRPLSRSISASRSVSGGISRDNCRISSCRRCDGWASSRACGGSGSFGFGDGDSPIRALKIESATLTGEGRRRGPVGFDFGPRACPASLDAGRAPVSRDFPPCR